MHRVAHRVAVCARVIDGRSVYFFQAEDGIRDIGVTGVQTCALPICVPGLDQALAAVRSGDTLVVPKLDRLDRLARDRKSVGEGKSVDLGGRRIIKKKSTYQCNDSSHAVFRYLSYRRNRKIRQRPCKS